MNEHCVVGVYDVMSKAEEAIRKLDRTGFPIKQVSIVGQNLQSEKEVHGYVTAGDIAKGGAGTGAWVGGLFGLLIGAAFLWVFPTAFLMFKLIDKTIGLRVSPEEEMEGLDLAEHGGNAYPDFGVSSYSGSAFSGGSGFPGTSNESVGQLKPVSQS